MKMIEAVITATKLYDVKAAFRDNVERENNGQSDCS